MLPAVLKVIEIFMGAETFYEISSGKTPEEAFIKAVNQALYNHGHSGYTGTIGEKTTFTMAADVPMFASEANALAESLIDTTYSDKWGPAGCIQIQTNSDKNSYFFFGWASS